MIFGEKIQRMWKRWRYYPHLTVYITVLLVEYHSCFPHCFRSVDGLLWGAEPRFELGPSLQQADALLSEPRRTLRATPHPSFLALLVPNYFKLFLVNTLLLMEKERLDLSSEDEKMVSRCTSGTRLKIPTVRTARWLSTTPTRLGPTPTARTGSRTT